MIFSLCFKMSSSGALEEVVAKIISGMLLFACNQTSTYGEYGKKTQVV